MDFTLIRFIGLLPSRAVHRRRSLVLALAALAAVGCEDNDVIGPAEGDPTGVAVVELVPAQIEYPVAATVVVEITIRDAVDVGSIPFRLHYDPTVLAFVPPAVEGTFMQAGGAQTVFLVGDAEGGGELVVGLSRLGNRPGASGSGTLATFAFDALAPGSSGFVFSGASVKDPQARSQPATFIAADVQVMP